MSNNSFVKIKPLVEFRYQGKIKHFFQNAFDYSVDPFYWKTDSFYKKLREVVTEKAYTQFPYNILIETNRTFMLGHYGLEYIAEDSKQLVFLEFQDMPLYEDILKPANDSCLFHKMVFFVGNATPYEIISILEG